MSLTNAWARGPSLRGEELLAGVAGVRFFIIFCARATAIQVPAASSGTRVRACPNAPAGHG